MLMMPSIGNSSNYNALPDVSASVTIKRQQHLQNRFDWMYTILKCKNSATVTSTFEKYDKHQSFTPALTQLKVLKKYNRCAWILWFSNSFSAINDRSTFNKKLLYMDIAECYLLNNYYFFKDFFGSFFSSLSLNKFYTYKFFFCSLNSLSFYKSHKFSSLLLLRQHVDKYAMFLKLDAHYSFIMDSFVYKGIKNRLFLKDRSQYGLNLWVSKKDICATITENTVRNDIFFSQKHLMLFMYTNTFVKYLKLRKQLRKKNQVILLMFKYLRRLIISLKLLDINIIVESRITAYTNIFKYLFYPVNEIFVQPATKKVILDISFTNKDINDKLSHFRDFFFNKYFFNSSGAATLQEAIAADSKFTNEWSKFTKNFLSKSSAVEKNRGQDTYFRYALNSDFIYFKFTLYNYKSFKFKKRKSLKKRMVKRIVSACYNRSWIF